MNVLLINGSSRKNGNTSIALEQMVNVFNENKIQNEIITIGQKDIRGCVACNVCMKKGECVYNDIVNEIAPKFEKCNGLVIASPVYYASANGTLISLLDRLFYSTSFDKTMKVGASVATARRGGITSTYDELNKYFGISGMPIVSGQYWNGIHGSIPGEANEDTEGLQQMKTLAKNMVFIMKSIELGKKEYGLPKKENPVFTNFIR